MAKTEIVCDVCGQNTLHEGHGVPCYYCGVPCDALAGNPGLWPIGLTHRKDLGKVRWHHIKCVQERLIENVYIGEETLDRWIEDANHWRNHKHRQSRSRETWHMIWFLIMLLGGVGVILASCLNPWVPIKSPLIMSSFAIAVIGLIQCLRFKHLLTPVVQPAVRAQPE